MWGWRERGGLREKLKLGDRKREKELEYNLHRIEMSVCLCVSEREVGGVGSCLREKTRERAGVRLIEG